MSIFKKWWFVVTMFIGLLIVIAIHMKVENPIDRARYVFIFCVPLIGVTYQIVQMIRGNDMSSKTLITEVTKCASKE